MLGNNQEKIKKNKELETNHSEFTRDCDYLAINFATGDQFKKIATLRSKVGPITAERVKEFYDEAAKEGREWRKNHPGESVTIRILENEDGEQKQIIEAAPKNDLICPSNFRSRIYDLNTGKQIVGEENIRKEIERREEQWEKWRKNGKLEKVDHEVHHTDDGNSVSVFTLLPPVKMLHENEINDETKWIPIGFGDKKLEGGKASQQSKNKAIEGSGKNEDTQKKNVEDRSAIEKIKKNESEWSVKKLVVELSNGVKAEQDCLVHDSAKVNLSELGTLIYPVEMFTDSEREELSRVLGDSLIVNFLSSGKVNKEEILSNCHSVSPLSSRFDNNPQQTDNGKNGLIVFGVVFVSLIAGLAIVKRKFIKRK